MDDVPPIPAKKPRVFVWLGAGLCFVLSFGTIGYSLIERWGFFDSFYMTVITLTTVGFTEVHPLSTAGRIHTILLIGSGVGLATGTATVVGRLLLDGTLARMWRRRRMDARIGRMDNHCIVCGYGRTGRALVGVLRQREASFVIIEKDPLVATEIEDAGLHAVVGNGHDNDVLLAAGVERARAVFACASSDAENIFICLSARSIRPDILIASRCDEPTSESKLRKAGANHVVSTYELAGKVLASSIVSDA